MGKNAPRVILRILLQNFMKTYRTFLKKQRKRLKMCSPLPKKNATQNSSKQRATIPIKSFTLTTIRVFIKNTCGEFHKKPNVSQKIEKKCHKTDRKTPQNRLQERRTCCENFFQCSKHWSNTKNVFTNLYEKGFNSGIEDKQRINR